MSKLIRLFLVLGLASPVMASTVNVTATITDGDGQTWNNCTWSATLISPNGTATIAGVPVTPTFASGLCSGSGVITVTLTNTSSIDQQNAQWQFSILPNATASAPWVVTTPVTTSNLSTILSSNLRGPRFPAGTAAFGYSNLEVFPTPALGATYYNVTNGCTVSYGTTGWSSCPSAGGGSTAPPAILPATSNFVTAGDSLCVVNGLTSPQSWPQLLGTLPVFASRTTVTNTCHSGLTLAGMVSDYTTEVHPHSPAVTGNPAILGISIYGNDIANISTSAGGSCASSCTYTTVAAYETAYAAYLASAIADGYAIMFMEQWAQTARQAYDTVRLQFNEYNRNSTQVNYYLSTVGRMNDPTNLTMYQVDGQHETVIGSAQIAADAQALLYSGGKHFEFAQAIFENPTQGFPVRSNVAGAALNISNTNTLGYSGADFYDSTFTKQGGVGYANSGVTNQPNGPYLYSRANTVPVYLCPGGATNILCDFAAKQWGFGLALNINDRTIDLYDGGSATTQIGMGATSGYNHRVFAADQAGALITFGKVNGNGDPATRTYTDFGTFNHDGMFGAAFGVTGPATAPSGSCAASGASGGSLAGTWVFSQDGHATYCNAGTWATKI